MSGKSRYIHNLLSLVGTVRRNSPRWPSCECARVKIAAGNARQPSSAFAAAAQGLRRAEIYEARLTKLTKQRAFGIGTRRDDPHHRKVNALPNM